MMKDIIMHRRRWQVDALVGVPDPHSLVDASRRMSPARGAVRRGFRAAIAGTVCLARTTSAAMQTEGAGAYPARVGADLLPAESSVCVSALGQGAPGGGPHRRQRRAHGASEG